MVVYGYGLRGLFQPKWFSDSISLLVSQWVKPHIGGHVAEKFSLSSSVLQIAPWATAGQLVKTGRLEQRAIKCGCCCFAPTLELLVSLSCPSRAPTATVSTWSCPRLGLTKPARASKLGSAMGLSGLAGALQALGTGRLILISDSSSRWNLSIRVAHRYRWPKRTNTINRSFRFLLKPILLFLFSSLSPAASAGRSEIPANPGTRSTPPQYRKLFIKLPRG